MRSRSVKPNLSNGLPWILALAAGASFLLSATGLLPAAWVEHGFSRGIFPLLSSWAGAVSGLTGASLLDWLLPAALLLGGVMLYRRRPRALLGGFSAAYLAFFWGWGMNYHRLPIETRLDVRADAATAAAMAQFVEEAAGEINGAYPAAAGGGPHDPRALAEAADARVRAVIAVLDGVPAERWGRPARVKTSRLLDPFFRAAGVTGMFNPFGHEALAAGGLLEVERPMVALHEIAHARGYADEGEASFVALLGAVHAPDPRMRYSGWLSLWMHMRSPENDALLDAGPREDLDAVARRVRRERIAWVSRGQGRALDAYLRANRVPDGVRSYSRIVGLAAGTRHDWERFRQP